MRQVCEGCLEQFYQGEKTCTHGWDFATGKRKTGPCSECGRPATSLHCPDGPRTRPGVGVE